jgi:hypothetical protein
MRSCEQRDAACFHLMTSGGLPQPPAVLLLEGAGVTDGVKRYLGFCKLESKRA